MLFVFLFLTQYGNLQVHRYCCKWHYFILFMVEQYSFVYMYHVVMLMDIKVVYMSRLCKQCCKGTLGCMCLFKIQLSLDICPERTAGSYSYSYFLVLEEPPYSFPQRLHQFTFSQCSRQELYSDATIRDPLESFHITSLEVGACRERYLSLCNSLGLSLMVLKRMLQLQAITSVFHIRNAKYEISKSTDFPNE